MVVCYFVYGPRRAHGCIYSTVLHSSRISYSYGTQKYFCVQKETRTFYSQRRCGESIPKVSVFLASGTVDLFLTSGTVDGERRRRRADHVRGEPAGEQTVPDGPHSRATRGHTVRSHDSLCRPRNDFSTCLLALGYVDRFCPCGHGRFEKVQAYADQVRAFPKPTLVVRNV